MKTIEKTPHRIPYNEEADIYTDDEEVINKVCEEMFTKTDEVIVTPILEGINVSIEYINGKIDKVISIGNGKIGNDYSNQLYLIDNLPLEIKCCDTPVIIKGKLTVYYEDFMKSLESRFSIGRPTYKTITHMLYSMLENDDDDLTENVIQFIATDLITSPGGETYVQQLDILKDEGFDVIDFEILRKDSFYNVENVIYELNKKRNENYFEEYDFVEYRDNLLKNWKPLKENELPYKITYMY